MSNAIVSNVYRYVIDDVINQVRGEFEDMGIDEAVLQELQRSWETKVARSRVANFGFNNDGYYDDESEQNNVNNDNDNNGNNSNNSNIPPTTTTATNNNNNVYSETYSQTNPPAANLATIANSGVRSSLRPETITNTMRPPQSQNQNTLQQQSASISYNLPPANMPHLPPVNGSGQYSSMQQHQQNSLPDLQLPGGGRPNIPQNDGVNDNMTTEEIDAHISKIVMDAHEQQQSSIQDDSPSLSFSATNLSGEALAMDNLPEHIKLLMKDARERAIQAGAISSKSRIAQLDGEDDNDDINSDLDDSDDADDDAEGGEEIEHIILCLYDKVTRTKNKWKCVLKDGIMLVNGRDYLFHRANGDFEW
ncbi:transcription factor IIA, alpha/beta subunit [Halteromyces radiatus]|uniref:transcription factor IIA, alpha/beta subunit n=1 Tax=Halteromyces radiatus TaxID=101107 RepID=UPI00221EA681|nr:transcription factor IIA, alpha/beta subunit [Halteromyces radiatus]KAI8081769.1 transcription factor IIA, alpha/beta subunit [Halteromyces radiatus]